MTEGGTCIFVNGLPGSGKSTYARSFVESRRGWLNLDVDLLRGLLDTASIDFVRAGAEVQPLALAVLREQIGRGGDVIFPQLFFTPAEAAPFEDAVAQSGGRVVRTLLHEDAEECWRRVQERAHGSASGSIDRRIRALLAEAGGALELERMQRQLSSWSGGPEAPRIINSSTPHEELALLAAG
ncbi:hypothetical protein DY023_02520 [Microbacterium bovistercoris]|uniref:Uncharacterized protein n=1 Tax=Microbacterium bovistercoris TaxID=2293570 RepID=A0A371NXE5_9MICO|nr:AAA family ATPase [Microbacterium bovistercoris]REJ07858.1 hypothetical protein DY023_02520 [Microbacterium bovistercoris]